jgi:hypothetical protein
MKNIFLITFFVYSVLVVAQVEPSVSFDPVTGNYIIEYEGYDGESEVPVLIHEIFEPSTKIDPFVKVITTKLSDSSYFRYDYELINSSSSIQRLYNFYLYISSDISEITIPDENWYTGFFSYIPVFHWYNSKGEAGLSDPDDGIAPDSSVDGFSFVSYGLPTITNVYFKGNPTIFLSFPDEPPGEISELLKPIRKFPNNTVMKKTVSPKDPPYPLIISSFLDTLLNYVSQSYMLEWITDETTANKYTNFFTTAKDQIIQEDSSVTRSTLENVLREVDIDSTNYLTSEAYALLRYNTEYLVEQLPAGVETIFKER